MTREVNELEKFLICAMANKLNEQRRAALLRDLSNATVSYAEADCSRVQFAIAGYNRPVYRGQQSFGVDGEMSDADGTKVSVALYGDENGRLLELELVRWVGGQVIAPRVETLALF